LHTFSASSNPLSSVSNNFREQPLALGRKAAEESCVLLKNNGMLPLKENAKVAFVGPFVEEREIIGNWSKKAHIEDAVCIKEGVERLLKRVVPSASGCSRKLFDTDESGFEEAEKVCKDADFMPDFSRFRKALLRLVSEYRYTCRDFRTYRVCFSVPERVKPTRRAFLPI